MGSSLSIHSGYGFIIPGDEDWDYDREALVERINPDETDYSEDFYDVIDEFSGRFDKLSYTSYGVHDYTYGYLFFVKSTEAYDFEGYVELKTDDISIDVEAQRQLQAAWEIVYPDKPHTNEDGTTNFKHIAVASYW